MKNGFLCLVNRLYFLLPGGDTEACEGGASLAIRSSTIAQNVPTAKCVLHIVSVLDGKTDPYTLCSGTWICVTALIPDVR